MDAALQSMLSGQGEGGGMRLFGVFPDMEGANLDSMMNPSALNLDELLKKILPLMNQALIFNFPGGFLWQKIFKYIMEKLREHVESHALSSGHGEGHGISGGAHVGHGDGLSPSSGGGGGGGHELH